MTVITSSINEQRFLKNLKTLFSTSTVMLSELMQNARRAGATSIRFDYDANETKLTVIDDGSGINDFQELITVAGSGWNQEVMENERPFGIGFLSVSFAAERVSIESHAGQIEFSSGDLIEKRPIVIKPTSFQTGTRITLSGCRLGEKIGDALEAYARGFPVPVFWNGKELLRPHDRYRLDGVNTPVGFIHVPGIHDSSGDFFTKHGHVYCQGLPITVEGFSQNKYSSLHAPIVHIDHSRYLPRMPDRDCLIDPKEAARDLDQTLRSIWRKYLESKKASMPSLDFATQYWEMAHRSGCLDLMKDLPVLPEGILWQVESMPILTQYHQDDYFESLNRHLTQEEVEAGGVMLFRHYPIYDGSDKEFLRLSWAHQAKNVVFISASDLPDDHWAHKHLRNLETEVVQIDGKTIAEGYFKGRWADGQIKLMENLEVTIAGIRCPMINPFAVTKGHSNDAQFFVPQDAVDPGFVLRQVSMYTNDNDYFVESDYEEDAEDFAQQIAIMAGERPEQTLRKVIDKGGARSWSNLRRTSFRVQFDANGMVSVMPE